MCFCSNSASIWQVVGYFLLVFKIVIPLLLIIFGMIDLGKAVISSDDKAVQKAAKSLLMRVIAGVCVFFIPTIIGVAFTMVGNFTEVKGQYDICSKCISSPNSEACKLSVQQEGTCDINKTDNNN